ncbi:zinc finger protein 14-like [Ceratitis capitata]|uniref:zinc finger protein 14-like n=1 Tax=Ceratitis capitata TaxID=7213 RepID=UPI000C6C8331|nr:zinc finger protein 14-like [Ceratitis capitata]
MGGSSNNTAALAAAHCPTPFTFPFTPFGLSLFDIDPSRILGMLRHQTWLAEEALKNRTLLNTSKDFAHRFNPIGELFAKDFHPNHLNVNTADLLAGVAGVPNNQASAASPAKQTISPGEQQQQTRPQQQTERPQQQQYKQQQQQPQTFNVRYPSPAAFFHHQQQQQQQQHLKQMSSRQGTPSPHATASSTQTKADATPTRHSDLADADSIIELTTHDEARDSGRESAVHTPNNSSGGTSSGLGTSTSATSSVALSSTTCSPLLYKESLEQLLQRRRSGSSLGGASDSLRPYSQLFLSSSTPGCTDTSSCKEKSSSSSTSSTPPPTSTLLAQHQLLSQRLNSPSETSSLFGEPIEEETRCVVCNAHFPNVWLLEQHAALQHPHIGPGEEKPFICEQCGQSYRYRSAYAKHKEQNHRARLPADKLFTCDVCGMQFRYLKSFKKHRLNHALERLHGKKSVMAKHCIGPMHPMLGEQDVVTSSQEPMPADEGGEDLRINVKREQDDDEREQRDREDQDCTIDSAGMIMCKDNNSSLTMATASVVESSISSSDGIHSTNKGPRLLNTPQMETDPSYHHLQRHPQHPHPHHVQQTHQQQQQQQPLPPHLHGNVAGTSLPPHPHQHPHAALPHTHHPHAHHAHHAAASTLNSLNSLNSITSLINAERIPNEQFLGLNPQEASILNFLRVDAAERQRDKRPQTSRFACPFCGKCVRSKENLKLHVRKHTGERPFVCLFCGRAFGGKSDLTRHLRIHTGERPYHCESCGKCFARADYLSKHLTTHIHNAPR